MALQLAATIKGFSYPLSYWRRSWYNFDDVTQRGTFILTPYPSSSARQASLENSLDAPRTYLITKEMTKAECYEYAKTFLDGSPPHTVMTGSDEETGEPSYVTPPDERKSFFDGAIDV